jgi:hypothetical protein
MSQSSTSVNIYYGKDKKLMESFPIEIGRKISSIDDARFLIINHLDSFYVDVKYKINVFSTFDGETTINLFFEEDISLNRELLLRKILE